MSASLLSGGHSIEVRIDGLMRLTDTEEGNPRWAVEFYLIGTDPFTAMSMITARDAQAGRVLDDSHEGRRARLDILDGRITGVSLRWEKPASPRHTLVPEEPAPACTVCGVTDLNERESARIEKSLHCQTHREEALAKMIRELRSQARDVMELARLFKSVPPAHRGDVSMARMLLILAGEEDGPL